MINLKKYEHLSPEEIESIATYWFNPEDTCDKTHELIAYLGDLTVESSLAGVSKEKDTVIMSRAQYDKVMQRAVYAGFQAGRKKCLKGFPVYPVNHREE